MGNIMLCRICAGVWHDGGINCEGDITTPTCPHCEIARLTNENTRLAAENERMRGDLVAINNEWAATSVRWADETATRNKTIAVLTAENEKYKKERDAAVAALEPYRLDHEAMEVLRTILAKTPPSDTVELIGYSSPREWVFHWWDAAANNWAVTNSHSETGLGDPADAILAARKEAQ